MSPSSSHRSGRRRGSGPAAERPAGGDGLPADPQAGPDADPEAVARAILLRQLSAAPRSRADLARTLAERAVPEVVATRVLDRFTQVGLVDDVAFAEMLVRSRQSGRGLARKALAVELRRHGVPDELVGAALTQVRPEDEMAAARGLVARRLPATRGLDRQVRTRRLVGMLARKGYPTGLALRVVAEALDGVEDPGSD